LEAVKRIDPDVRSLLQRTNSISPSYYTFGKWFYTTKLEHTTVGYMWPENLNEEEKTKLTQPYFELWTIVNTTSGQKFLDQIRKRMDWNGYMRFLAIQTILENGDYQDELFFYGLQKGDQYYFGIFPWDFDGSLPISVSN
jgi:spore coat protein CotH